MSSRTRSAAYILIASLIGAAIGGAGVYAWSASGSRAQAGPTSAEQTDLAAARARVGSLQADLARADALSGDAATLANGLRCLIAEEAVERSEPRLLSTEPSGDIPSATVRRGVAFLARISSISTETRKVTFDMIVDTGRRSPNSDESIYANRHRHPQTIKLRSLYIPVVMPQGQGPEGLDPIRVGDWFVAGLDQYALSAQGEDGFLKQQIFIVHVDSSGIFELEQVFQV